MRTEENFIPWSMIEPLLTPGMGADELKAALCKLTGLDPSVYRFVTKTYTGNPNSTTLAECIRAGLYVERYDKPTGTAVYISATGQPVR